MNRFRKLGYIDYSYGHLKVYKLLLTAVLKDDRPEEDNASRTPVP
jgi:hypothetical protein